MTPVRTHNGFTIVEVILFLALAGLVFLVGFSGIGGRSRAVQFTDSIRSVDSFLQKQLNDVVNGVNNGVLTSDTAPDEMLLGKIIAFCTPTNTHPRCTGSTDSSRALAYSVVGDVLSPGLVTEIIRRHDAGDPTSACSVSHGPLGDSEVRLLDCTRARVVGAPEVVNIEWGTEHLGANNGVQNYSASAFAFLRSPNSSRVLLISYYSGAPSSPPADNALIGLIEQPSGPMFNSTSNGYSSSGSTALCFRSANEDKYATVLVGASERQTAVETIFDPEWTPVNQRGGQIPNSCGPN